MKSFVRGLVVGLYVLTWIGVWNASAFAENAAMTKDMLKIMRDNGDISDQTYQQLIDKIEKDKQKKTPLNAFWDSGLRLESGDKGFRIHVGGRVLNDWAAIDADSEIAHSVSGQILEGTGTKLRQARLQCDGLIYDKYTFSAEYDFAGSNVTMSDVWMGMKAIPYVGEARIGHQKEPFSLERMDSLKYIPCLERGLIEVFTPGRNSGLKIHHAAFSDRIAWGLGAFKDVKTSDGFDNGSDYNITGRITGTPWYENKSALLHLGMGISHKFYNKDEGLQYRIYPETYVTDMYAVDTGKIKNITDVDLVGPEFAFVYGSFSLQSEYIHSYLTREAAGDPDFYGYYVVCSYFLTGESREYVVGEGGHKFGKVIPNQPFQLDDFGSCGFCGAWQIAGRYSFLDLNDQEIKGGKAHNYTLALNWYLNQNMKMAFNYVMAIIDQRSIVNNNTVSVLDDQRADIYSARFQIEF